MIVVKVEIWPLGDEARKRTVATAVVENDGTGTLSRGNYLATLFLKQRRIWRMSSVVGFPRKRQNVWDLLHKVLQGAVGERARKTTVAASRRPSISDTRGEESLLGRVLSQTKDTK